MAIATALVAIGVGVPPAGAAVSVSNVTVQVTAPEQSFGAFQATATVRNTGTLYQPGGTKVTLTTTRGAISNLPSNCKVTKKGHNECTAGRINAGQSVPFTFTVTPTSGATSVVTSAKVEAARGEFNVGGDDGDEDSKLTQIVGVALDLTNAPTEVRYGDDALLRSAVTNHWTSAQQIALVLDTGNVRDADQSNFPEACSTSVDNATVTCTASYGPGETKSFDVVVVSPSSGPSFTSSATATGSAVGSATDTVTTALSQEAAAFVSDGEQLTSDDEKTRTTFTVTEGSTQGGGLPVTLNEVDLAEDCGGQPCLPKAAEALFPNEGAYSGDNPEKPFVWDITYEVPRDCNTSGDFCLYREIFYIPSGGETAISMPKCETFVFPSEEATPAAPVLADVDEVCLNFVSWDATSTTYQVALLRDIIIPIIGGVKRR